MIAIDHDIGKTSRRHLRPNRLGRQEIGEVTRQCLRKIVVIEPVQAVVRAHVEDRQASAGAQHAKRLVHHSRFVAEMVERVLAAGKIETAGSERQYRAVAVDPAISADLARAWRSMPSEPSSPTILASGAIARLATSWLPVPQAMSKSSAVPSAVRSARNAASAGSGDLSRP